MPVKVGNSYVSEVAYSYAKSKVEAENESVGTEKKSSKGMSVLSDLQSQYKNLNFSTNTAPFSGKGTNNLAIAPNILREMEENPEKRLEYEALIYDCNEVLSRPTRDGIKAQGMIIEKDGSLSMWSIGVSNDNTKSKSQMLLDRTKPLKAQINSKKKKKTVQDVYKEFQEKKAGKVKISEKRKTDNEKAVSDKGPVESRTNDYLNKIQNMIPYMKVQNGNSLSLKRDGQVNTLTINPKLIEKMQNDPEKEKEYMQRLKDIEAATKWVDAYERGIGMQAETRHVYVDEDGNMSVFAHVVRKDTQNEKLRKEAEENAKELIEKSKERAAERRKELSEKLEEKKSEDAKKAEDLLDRKISENEDGNIRLDSEEMDIIIRAARHDNQDSRTTGDRFDAKM